MIFERSELMHAQNTAIGMWRIMIIPLELGCPIFTHTSIYEANEEEATVLVANRIPIARHLETTSIAWHNPSTKVNLRDTTSRWIMLRIRILMMLDGEQFPGLEI